MPLRLFNKQEIEQKKAAERARTVQEGLELAKRVDGLRETQANEETSLKTFRETTISAIYEDIEKEEKVLDGLRDEVKELEERKAEARKSLGEEWQNVRNIKESIEQKSEEIERRDREIIAEKEAISEEKSQLDYDIRMFGDDRQEYSKALSVAQEDRENARRILENAQKVLEETGRLEQKVKDELIGRESSVYNTEERQLSRDLAQDTREKELNELESRLKDFQSTLLRTKERLHGKRLS